MLGRHGRRPRPVSRVESLVDAHPRPRPHHRRHPPGADPRRVRERAPARSASPGCGPASTSRPSGACPSRPSPSPSRSISPGPTSPRSTPSGWATSRGSTGPTSCATCGTRWATSMNYAYRLYDAGGVGQAVRLDHPAVRRGVPAGAVQPPLRAPPAGVVRPEAPRRGLGGDVRGVDDARGSTGGRSTAAGRWPRPSWPTASGPWRRIRDRDPVVTAAELDEDVGDIEYSLGQYYRDDPGGPARHAARAGRRAAGDLRGPERGGGHVARRAAGAGGRADPPAGARADGQRVPLDRALPRADPRAAPATWRSGPAGCSRATRAPGR